MTDKHKSIFKVMLDSVSKIPWLKVSRAPVHEGMIPDKDFNKPASNHAFDYLKELNDEEFDKLIALMFNQRGYKVSEKRNKEEGGADVVLHQNNETTLIQYRHWREHHVDAIAIEELYNFMKEESASHGIVVTSGIFTEEALDFALGKALMLINGVDLSQMVVTLNSLNEENEGTEAEEKMSSEEKENEMPELEPLCPICSQKMIKRTAKKGKNAGNTFWGCSQFPNCRGVVSN